MSFVNTWNCSSSMNISWNSSSTYARKHMTWLEHASHLGTGLTRPTLWHYKSMKSKIVTSIRKHNSQFLLTDKERVRLLYTCYCTWLPLWRMSNENRIQSSWAHTHLTLSVNSRQSSISRHRRKHRWWLTRICAVPRTFSKWEYTQIWAMLFFPQRYRHSRM
jgi:hypothetical protein